MSNISDIFTFDDSVFDSDQHSYVIIYPDWWWTSEITVDGTTLEHSLKGHSIKISDYYIKISHYRSSLDTPSDLAEILSKIPSSYLCALQLMFNGYGNFPEFKSYETTEFIILYRFNIPRIGVDYLYIKEDDFFSIGSLLHNIGHFIENNIAAYDQEFLTNWEQHIIDDNIQVSSFESGHSNNIVSEDIAEFSKYYAFASKLGGSNLETLSNLSPRRYNEWENCLRIINEELRMSKPPFQIHSLTSLYQDAYTPYFWRYETLHTFTDEIITISGPTTVSSGLRDNVPGFEWVFTTRGYCFKISMEQELYNTDPSEKFQHIHNVIQKIPTSYLVGLEVISGHNEVIGKQEVGTVFYSDIGGALGHGSAHYISIAYDTLFVGETNRLSSHVKAILHEIGHALEQEKRTTEGDSNILDRWEQHIINDRIDVSTYGNTNRHEDQAEFSVYYAYALYDEEKLNILKHLSPNRFAEWEDCLNRFNDVSDLRPNTFSILLPKLSDTFIFDDSIFLPQNDCEILFGPKAVTMQLGSHTGQRWNVKRENYYFKITIQDGNPSSNVDDLLSTVSSLPTDYLAGLEFVSGSTEDGLAIYNNTSSLGGDSSSHDNYLNVVDYSIDILLHQIGHVIEHKLSLLNNWGTYKTNDIIEVSPLGTSNLSEDIAEFSKYYAFALQSGDSNLSELASLSPERYTAWENGLTRVNNPSDLKLDIGATLTPSVKIVKHHIRRKNVIQNRHAFVHIMTRHINAAHPDAPIGQGQNIDSSPKYEDVFTSPEPTQIKDMNWDGSNYVMPDEHSADYIIDGNDVKDYQQDVENANIATPLPEFSDSNWVEDVTSGS
jgi:sulfur carrier protein ThiS